MNPSYSISQADQDDLINKLEIFVEEHLPLGRAMKISVTEFNGQQLSLSAPLVHNNNDKGTAFGGSLYCLAVMSCWSWFYLRCLDTRIEPIGAPNIVVTKASIDYLLPVTDETITATCRLDDESIWQDFVDQYGSKGSAKIQLDASIYSGSDAIKKKAVIFTGSYGLLGAY
ncbi:MAG: YiiD C-terminal domain-containing protein [Pseudomonadales bacterium]|nr:YiiD C-terminal domain-containing protein [Pseudomonadales bacterium]